MSLNINTAGVSLTILGALSLLIASLYHETSGGDLTKPWYKRYWWYSWKPFYVNTKTLKFHIKWNHIIINEGFIPLKVKFEVLGFILIVIGSLFQLIQ